MGIPIGITLVVLVAGCLTAYLLLRRPGAGVAQPKDFESAKAAGRLLLESRDETFVVFAAHPDDAEWWAGGTLGLLAKDNRVILVLGTSGDAGNGGGQKGLGALREKLQLEVQPIMGYSEVIFLRHPDGHLGEAKDYPAQVRDLMRRFRPAAVFSFDIEHEAAGYHHVDHEAAGRATLAAAREIGGQTLYLFHTSAPDVLVDYGTFRADKTRALQILWSYHDEGSFGFLWVWLQKLGFQQRTLGTFGASTRPSSGITWGELFRKEQPE